MKAEQSRPSADADARRGITHSIAKAWSGPLLVDQAADAAFAGMIDRLRGEPGSNGGKQ